MRNEKLAFPFVAGRKYDAKVLVANRSIGILGGAFDPVHLGHLHIAEGACKELGLDRLIFIPATRSPLREESPRASVRERRAMLALALEGNRRFEIDDVELDRGGVCYSIDTAHYLRERYPDRRLLWIIGADHAARLPQWHRIEQLVGLVEFAIFPRPGFDAKPPIITGLRAQHLTGVPVAISSSEVRERIAKGLSVGFSLPPEVHRYICQQRLYGLQ